MDKIIDVTTGKVATHTGPGTLRAVAIGSCIVVAAYDTKAKVAGMAHIMLPAPAPQKAPDRTRYADAAIEELLNQMSQSGSNPDNIAVCLVGAGNVLKKEDDTICDQNIRSITQILTQKKIPIKASILGGHKRKSIFLNTQTGTTSYTQADDQQKPLWNPPQ